MHAVMDQVNRAFVPDLLVIPVGSTVSFPNSDSVSHQIYSFSPAKRFQLPLYRGKPYPPVHFDQAGVVTLGCNIHDEMLAYLLVTDAPYYGRTDASGTWSVEVPRGHYRISIWHPRLRDEAADLERELTVRDSRPRRAHHAPGEIAAAGTPHRPAALLGLLRLRVQPPRAFHDLARCGAAPPRGALLVTLAVLTAPGARAATDWEASLDLRLVSSDAEPLLHGWRPRHAALRQR